MAPSLQSRFLAAYLFGLSAILFAFVQPSDTCDSSSRLHSNGHRTRHAAGSRAVARRDHGEQTEGTGVRNESQCSVLFRCILLVAHPFLPCRSVCAVCCASCSKTCTRLAFRLTRSVRWASASRFGRMDDGSRRCQTRIQVRHKAGRHAGSDATIVTRRSRTAVLVYACLFRSLPGLFLFVLFQ